MGLSDIGDIREVQLTAGLGTALAKVLETARLLQPSLPQPNGVPARWLICTLSSFNKILCLPLNYISWHYDLCRFV